ncbi:MAG: hypothetical protein D6733_02660 [Methanobacteriota archaeon]|nr:MAG: hypothetical protein D6733_02660 [Euryarchaeota archaeon]
MNGQRDYPTIILGLLGLLSAAYAIRLTVQGISGRLFYIFLSVQVVVALYLLYVVVSKGITAWTEYRWRPDRLR